MKALLNMYNKTVEDIFSAFGIENWYGEICDLTEARWDGDSESVRWIGRDGEVYCNDVHLGPVFSENYALFYMDNGCGERFYQIFDTNLRDETIEK